MTKLHNLGYYCQIQTESYFQFGSRIKLRNFNPKNAMTNQLEATSTFELFGFICQQKLCQLIAFQKNLLN